MSSHLAQRLDQILPRVTAPDFLSSTGIGNEIACYIFDYPATEELAVRAHIDFLRKRFASHHPELAVLHIDLLETIQRYLEQRNLFAKALEMEGNKGSTGLLRALKSPLAAEKVRDFIAEADQPAEQDLVLMSGVGSVWPMLRAHNLLNCLHTILGSTPLVLFYPGRFDGRTLRLFDQIESADTRPGDRAYYRAFSLLS